MRSSRTFRVGVIDHQAWEGYPKPLYFFIHLDKQYWCLVFTLYPTLKHNTWVAKCFYYPPTPSNILCLATVHIIPYISCLLSQRWEYIDTRRGSPVATKKKAVIL